METLVEQSCLQSRDSVKVNGNELFRLWLGNQTNVTLMQRVIVVRLTLCFVPFS